MSRKSCHLSRINYRCEVASNTGNMRFSLFI
nr:MAG TPA: hypothetical protein [Caudoviricetes sp.]